MGYDEAEDTYDEEDDMVAGVISPSSATQMFSEQDNEVKPEKQTKVQVFNAETIQAKNMDDEE